MCARTPALALAFVCGYLLRTCEFCVCRLLLVQHRTGVQRRHPTAAILYWPSIAPNCQLSTTTRSASRPACSRCALYCFLIRPHHVQSAPMTLLSSVPCPVHSNVTQRERSNGNIQRLISTRPSTSWRCWFCGDVRAPLSNQNISAVRSTYSDTLPAGSVCYVLSHSNICLLFRRDAQKGLLLI